MPKFVLALLVAAFGLLAADVRPGIAEPLGPTATANDTARFLAGLQPSAGSPLEPLTKEPLWQQYAKHFEGEWAALEARQLSKARNFATKNVGSVRETVYYFFSGPDFLYANTFFPGAKTYLMSGLEPIGKLPDVVNLPRNALKTNLDNLRASLSDVLSRSYFITSHMDQKLRRGQLSGVLPVLYVFLARQGKTIEDVTYVVLQPDGTVKPYGETVPAAGPPRAVKIAFKGQDGKAQTLYFFSTNVANKGVTESGFLKFLDTFGEGDGFIKSASYLPHGHEFSMVREFLMSHSARIVQDDTGPPLREYKEGVWKVEPFGVYTRPIPPFTYAYQAQMKTLYDKAKPAALDFSYGYRFRNNQSNVQIATKVK